MENNKKKSLIPKAALIKAWLIWETFPQTCYNYERMMGQVVAHMFSTIIGFLYKDDPSKRKEVMKREIEFFNVHIEFGSCILGMAVALEEQKAMGENIPGEFITNLKTSLMGPLAGIGDTLFWTLLPTIMGSIAGYMALEGNPIGVILWLIVNLIFICIRTQLMWIGYREGTKLITKVGSKLARITDAASVLGLTVVGALSATVVTAKTPLAFQMGEVNLAVADLLDKIMPSMISVATVLVLYKLLGKKGMKITTLILIVIIFSMICSALGILA